MTKPKPRIKTSTTARVRVVVELQTGTWGTGCDVAQVYEQAAKESINRLRNALDGKVKIIGYPVVEAVTTSVEPR